MSTPVDFMSLAQLRCFLAVVETRSFAAAGRQLGMTTSGVSRTIARLEAAQGVGLLYRSTHAVSPTEAGEQLIDPARAVIADFAVVESTLRDLGARGAAGRVRLGAPPAFVRNCLVPLLPSFSAQHPDIALDLRASDAFADLARTGLDLAIRSGSLDGLPGHVRLPWFSFPWVVCASPAYFERRGTPLRPEELASHDLIGFRNTRTGVVDTWRLRNGVTIGHDLAWRIVIDDADSAWRAVLGGIGIAWVPYWLASGALASGEVVEALRDWRGGPTPFFLLRREQPRIPKRVEIVKEFLLAHPERLSWQGQQVI
jgi:DNA-binding transcriptional LysR family regulator